MPIVDDTRHNATRRSSGMESGGIVIDISGPIEDGMWSYDAPYSAPRIEQIPPPDWLEYPVYSQTVHFAVQAGSYLETAAHMDLNAMTIDELPLERCYMVDALHLWIPTGADQAITPAALNAACQAAGVQPRAREALLVGTGWDAHWHKPDFVTNPPYFTAAAIDWVLEHDFSILGGDTPRYDSPNNPQNFFPKFFKHDILLLAPLVNLGAIRKPRGKLVALPLKIQKACASPVRALWIEE